MTQPTLDTLEALADAEARIRAGEDRRRLRLTESQEHEAHARHLPDCRRDLGLPEEDGRSTS